MQVLLETSLTAEYNWLTLTLPKERLPELKHPQCYHIKYRMGLSDHWAVAQQVN